jgi:hypothetical protein
VKTVTTVANKQKTAVDSKNLAKLPLWLDATWHPKRPEWTSLHDYTSWPFCPQDGLCFSSSSSPDINQHSTTVNFFACWPLTFFWGLNFSSTLTLHTTLPPSYLTNLPLGLNLKPNQLTTNPLPTFSIFFWRNLYLFLAKPISIFG